MNQAQLIHSAKQGDTSALTTLLNQSLASRRVEIAEIVLEENVLHLHLKSRKIPNQHKLVPFISEELSTIGIPSIERVTVYGLTEESPNPLWEKSMTLNREPSLVNHVAKIDSRATIIEEVAENESESSENNEPAENVESGKISETPMEAVNEKVSESIPRETIERTLPSKRALDLASETKSGYSPLALGMAFAFLCIGFGFGLVPGMFLGYHRAISELSQPTGAIEQPR